MPRDGDPAYFESPSDFQLFSFEYTFKISTTLKSIRISKTCFSRQFQEAFLKWVIINLAATFMV